MPAKVMDINISGEYIELKREQWRGHIARVTNDPELLNEVKKYTWTYCEGDHPYLRNGVLGMSLHEFVLSHIYGHEHVKSMIQAGNIIEHLDNDGLNCAYDNLHIVSADWNKTKAFSIDKIRKELEAVCEMRAYATDVYYCHEEKYFQLQVMMNDDIYINIENKHAVEMFICIYTVFEDLYLDWLYLLNKLQTRRFDITKFHASKINVQERPYLTIHPDERNNPVIIRNGVAYLNLDAKDKNGNPMVSITHTAKRRVEYKEET